MYVQQPLLETEPAGSPVLGLGSVQTSDSTFKPWAEAGAAVSQMPIITKTRVRTSMPFPRGPCELGRGQPGTCENLTYVCQRVITLTNFTRKASIHTWPVPSSHVQEGRRRLNTSSKLGQAKGLDIT